MCAAGLAWTILGAGAERAGVGEAAAGLGFGAGAETGEAMRSCTCLTVAAALATIWAARPLEAGCAAGTAAAAAL